MSSGLQQRATRRTSVRVRWKRLQLDMSDEADHVWAGSGELMIDDVNEPHWNPNLVLIKQLSINKGSNEQKTLSEHEELSRVLLASRSTNLRIRWTTVCECLQDAIVQLR